MADVWYRVEDLTDAPDLVREYDELLHGPVNIVKAQRRRRKGRI